jgi:hypothetical protein
MRRHRHVLLLLLATAAVGCATSGATHHVVSAPPALAKLFTNVEVVPVVYAGHGGDSLYVGQLAALSHAIERALTVSGPFLPVLGEADREVGALLVDCRVTAYDRGSRFARAAVGLGVGRARLETLCDFVGLPEGGIQATARFRAEVNGGFFGGSGELPTLADMLAAEIARYLEEAFPRSARAPR